jgi:nucleoside-diphosphate-sugar epimerase
MAGRVSHMLFFGFGYSARVLAHRLVGKGWKITATARSDGAIAEIGQHGYRAINFSALAEADLDGVTHLVSSVPPGEGDPVLAAHGELLLSKALQWVGYLSTTGVYGDHGGAWVDEKSVLSPNTERGARRLAAEQAWLQTGLPVHLFRLAGIYGPGRNALESVRDGTARCIIKPGQVFSRIHVEDIATVLEASIARPHPGRAYNVCDDEPCPPQDVIAYAAHLLGVAPPPDIPFGEARLSPMARSFYADSKRVSNRRIKTELGVKLKYPTYREGLAALLTP